MTNDQQLSAQAALRSDLLHPLHPLRTARDRSPSSTRSISQALSLSPSAATTPRTMHTSSSGSPITPSSASQFPFSSSGSSGSLPADHSALNAGGSAAPGAGSAGMRGSTSESGQAQTHNYGYGLGQGPQQQLQAGYTSPPLTTAGNSYSNQTAIPSYSGGEQLSAVLSNSSSTHSHDHVHTHGRQNSFGGTLGRSVSREKTSPAHRYTSLPYPLPSSQPGSSGGPRPGRADSTGSGTIGAERPQRPMLHRNRTSQSSGGKDDVAAAAGGSGSGNGKGAGGKRASKACENCRLRRRKCSEARPCKACVDIGLGASCTFRAKARPNRTINLDSLMLDPPYVLPQTSVLSPSSVGLSHAHPVRDIDATVELWLAEQGQPMSLSLYDPPSLLADLGTKPLPPLLSPAAETHAVHSFLESTARYFAFLHGPRMLEMLRLHHATPTHQGFFISQHQPDVGSSGGLRPDERAMVYAAICLGRFKEIPPIQAGPGVQVPASSSRHNSTSGQGVGAGHGQASTVGMSTHAPTFGAGVRQEQKTVPLSVRLREMREDSGYFCRAVLELQKWGGASLTALGALHCLHLFTLLSGGAAEMRDVLGRMAWQVREMGLHAVDSAALFAAEDRVDRLFYTTLHEDNWFATLLDAPPFILNNTYDPSLTPSWDKGAADGERWIDQHPCVVQLTMFENELLTMIHTLPELSQAFLFDIEARLADWMKAFREEQLAVPSWMLHTYANIRFHWIMLRAPLLSNPHFRLASLTTVCRSASQTLLSYHSFADTASFLPTWGECRRILTCAHLVVLGHWEGEFLMTESEFLGGVAVALLEKLENGCPFLIGAKDRLMLMFGLLGIAPRKPLGMGPPPSSDPPEPGPAEVFGQATSQPGSLVQHTTSYIDPPHGPVPQVTAADYAISNFAMEYMSNGPQLTDTTGQISMPRMMPAVPMPELQHHHPDALSGLSGLFPVGVEQSQQAQPQFQHQAHALGAGLAQTMFAPTSGQPALTPFDTSTLEIHSHSGSPTGQTHNMLMSVTVAPPTSSDAAHTRMQAANTAIGMQAARDDRMEQDDDGDGDRHGTGNGIVQGEGGGDAENGQAGWLDPWLDAMLWTGSDGHSVAGSLGLQVGDK